MTEHCRICGRELDNPSDPFSSDCGGDCRACMAAAGDPYPAGFVDGYKAAVAALIANEKRYGIGSMCSQWTAEDVAEDLLDLAKGGVR